MRVLIRGILFKSSPRTPPKEQARKQSDRLATPPGPDTPGRSKKLDEVYRSGGAIFVANEGSDSG